MEWTANVVYATDKRQPPSTMYKLTTTDIPSREAVLIVQRHIRDSNINDVKLEIVQNKTTDVIAVYTYENETSRISIRFSNKRD